MDRFENMETFVRIVEAGGISAAAERLGVAKSAVSRRLKELEAHLGVELFHRTTRRMKLTETGRSFYHQSVRILQDLLEAELATSQQHGVLKGGLRAALPLSFGLMHLGPAVNEFLKMHPQIEFDLDFNDRQVDLIEEGFDLAVRIARLADSSLIARRIAPVQMVLCASPQYLERRGTPVAPEELQTHDCLAYSLERSVEYWDFYAADDRHHRVKIHPRLKAGSGTYLRDAAVDGFGIVLLPSFLAYQQIEAGSLAVLLRDYRCPRLHAYALYPQTRHLSQRVRAFVDFLVQRFAGVPYWDRCLQESGR